MNPRVSVLMPVFNGEKFIRQAIESILKQTFTAFELIIVDDGSTDRTQEIIRSYDDARINLLVNATNEGIVASRNKGIQNARGEFIAFLDADDISFPGRLQKQVAFLDNNPHTGVVATFLELIDADNNKKGYWHEDILYHSYDQIREMLPVINCIGQSTVMARRKVIATYGYNAKHYHSEDWGLWLTLLSEGHMIAKIPEVLVSYRVHPGSATIIENAKGVTKKIIRFKYSWLTESLGRGRTGRVFFSVLNSLLKTSAKSVAPQFVIAGVRILRNQPLAAGMQLMNANSKLKNLSPEILFFFPFYHTGGAEKVHASILESVKDRQTVTFITGHSTDNAYREAFEEYSTVIKIDRLLRFNRGKKWLNRKLSAIVSVSKQVRALGCNSKYYYELIPHIAQHVKCMDLIHAFVHDYEEGPEKWSLAVAGELSSRVVISRNTIDDLVSVYKRNGIPVSLADRIKCIPNYTGVKDFIVRPANKKLRALYVGRGGEEKRIGILADVAAQCATLSPEVEFHFAGDVKSFIPADKQKYCTLHGVVTGEAKMDELYSQSHFLLLSSSREGFPLVIMEGMMHGLVTISTNVGGIAEHIQNSVNGFLVDEMDSEAIVRRFADIIAMLSADRKRMEEIMKKAHEYAILNFQKDKFIASYRNLLNA